LREREEEVVSGNPTSTPISMALERESEREEEVVLGNPTSTPISMALERESSVV